MPPPMEGLPVGRAIGLNFATLHLSIFDERRMTKDKRFRPSSFVFRHLTY